MLKLGLFGQEVDAQFSNGKQRLGVLQFGDGFAEGGEIGLRQIARKSALLVLAFKPRPLLDIRKTHAL